MLSCLSFTKQEQQSTKGADPQPEFYIDQIVQLTAVSILSSLVSDVYC